MPDGSEQQLPISRLDDAVARGIISAEQRDALLALAPGAASAPEPRGEARSGLNAVMIAYHLGAAAVVFAFGWFIVDRWDALGPAGVLLVALLYAGIFLFAARYVEPMGFHAAASLLTLLAVGMTPLAAWALLRLTGLWYEPAQAPAPYTIGVDVMELLRWIPIELATALAALVALRRARIGLLALPIAAVVPAIMAQLLPLVVDPEITNEMSGWMALVAGTVVLAAGYGVDRRTRDGEDYARWIYLVALVTLYVGVLSVWPYTRAERHALPAVAVGLFALSLFLRRPAFVVFGALGVIAYLAYLAFDVFRAALSFPIVLATFGAGVIVVTVWLQRRYPALARQVEARQQGLRTVPHAGLAFGGAILVALMLFVTAIPEAHDHMLDRWTTVRRAAVVRRGGAAALHRVRSPAAADSDHLRAVPRARPQGR